MHDSHEFLRNLAMVLATAGITTLIFQRLRQPVIFGYLLAGMLIGPHVPAPLAVDADTVRTLSEVGVILLMYALGLDFSVRKLWQIGPTAGMIALLQSSALLAVGYLVGRAFGWTNLESVYAGAIIAISSTTIIVKAFEEQGVTGRFTRIVFGVLIVQDLIAILLLAILTTISMGQELSAAGLAMTAGKLATFLAALVIAGLLIVPRFMRAVVRLNRPETTIVTAVGLCFAIAYLAASFGYSVALGAFVAGMLTAESGHAKAIEHQVRPVRDVFAAIFFVSVGVMIDPRVVAEYWAVVLAFTVVVIVGQVLAVSIGAFLAGYGTRVAVQSGMSMAQIGEFSFIIAGLGLTLGATRGFLFPVAVAVSAITTLTTPWLIRSAGGVASWVDRTLPRPVQNFVALYASWMEGLARSRHDQRQRSRTRRLAAIIALDLLLISAVVVTVGIWHAQGTAWLLEQLGLTQRVARGLLLVTAAVVIVPLAIGLLRTARALGQTAAQRALPAPAPGKVDMAVASRRAIVVAWQLAILGLAAAPVAVLLELFIPTPATLAVLIAAFGMLGIAFWRSATNLQGHTRAGAEVIVAALASQMASPAGDASPSGHAVPRPIAHVATLLPGLGDPVSLRLSEGDYGVGKSLAELDIRDRSNATVLVIVRGGHDILLPVGSDKLAAGDLLAVAGTDKAVRAATALILRGE
jgi:CPA2 family monovalent cation:H+ antiporter-2